MKKKIIALCLIVALAATAVIGGTLAYFTDTDSAVNTFTVGNVKIDLIESTLHRSNASGNPPLGSPEYVDQLVPGDDYSAAHSWTNAYFPDAVIKENAKGYEAYLAEAGANMVPGSNVHKMPYVINTGVNDAYVRVRVLIPASLFVIIDNGPSMWTTTAMNVGDVTSKAVDAYFAAGSAEAYAESADKVNVGGVDYLQFDFTYTDALKPGEMTFWNCWGNIAIDKNATSEQLKEVDSFKVLVYADAIQADGFGDAAAAFAAFDA